MDLLFFLIVFFQDILFVMFLIFDFVSNCRPWKISFDQRPCSTDGKIVVRSSSWDLLAQTGAIDPLYFEAPGCIWWNVMDCIVFDELDLFRSLIELLLCYRLSVNVGNLTNLIVKCVWKLALNSI